MNNSFDGWLVHEVGYHAAGEFVPVPYSMLKTNAPTAVARAFMGMLDPADIQDNFERYRQGVRLICRSPEGVDTAVIVTAEARFEFQARYAESKLERLTRLENVALPKAGG